MVEIVGLIEQKEVRKAQKEEDRAQTIPEPQGDTAGEDTQEGEMDIHAISRPRFDPREAIKGEVEGWLDPITADPAPIYVTPDFPEHDQPKGNAEVG